MKANGEVRIPFLSYMIGKSSLIGGGEMGGGGSGSAFPSDKEVYLENILLRY